MTFFDPSQVPHREIAPGVRIRTMWGGRIMVSVVDLEPGSQVPSHTHPNEQMGMVLEGSMRMVIGGETRDLKQGDIYLASSDQEHSVTDVELFTRVLDIFSPPREDYKPGA